LGAELTKPHYFRLFFFGDFGDFTRWLNEKYRPLAVKEKTNQGLIKSLTEIL